MTTSDARRHASYWVVSRQPLQMLVFLLPLIVAYEAGLLLLLTSSDGTITNKAHEALLHLFERFDVPARSGFLIGGGVVVAVLLSWHLLLRSRWRVRWSALPLMLAESAVLAVPLLVLGMFLSNIAISDAAPLAVATPAAPAWEELGLLQRLCVSIGAGLYEELLFRMVLIGVLHTLLADVIRATPSLASIIAVVISAAAFTWYHVQPGMPSSRMAIYFLAGVYLGGVFLARGFGIVVWTHALYDVAVATLLTDPPAGG